MGHMTRVTYYRVTRSSGRLGLSPLVLVSRALRARSTDIVSVNTQRALYFILVVALICYWIDSSFVNQEQPTGSDSWELFDWTTDRRGMLGAKGRVALTIIKFFKPFKKCEPTGEHLM
jgi:hypothetical protein